jgi:hypothetical protein
MQGVALTPQEKEKFLAKLMSSAGNVTKASQTIKIARNTAYEHKKADADFSQAWDNVIEACADAAEQELYRRSIKGYVEPVFYKGEMVSKIRKFSDRLLEFYLKGKRPEVYRERLDINNTVQGSLDVNIEFEIDKIYGDTNDDSSDIGGDAQPDSPG